MTAPSRLKSTLELLVVLLLAFFVRLYVSICSRSRRNSKAGQMTKKREADGVSPGAFSPSDESPPSDPRLPIISQGGACCPHIQMLAERARRAKRR